MRVSAATFALALPLLAAANEVLPRQDGGQCNTGAQLCCNSTQQSTSSIANLLQGLLGIALPDITGLLGFNCSPLSALGLGGNSCSAQPVCCTNNQFNGLISLGCTPININL